MQFVSYCSQRGNMHCHSNDDPRPTGSFADSCLSDTDLVDALHEYLIEKCCCFDISIVT